MSDEPRKRSRFDRRSRSPPKRDNDHARERSPVARSIEKAGTPDKKPDTGAAAAAAAAAARINAMIQAKASGASSANGPPVRTSTTPGAAAGSAKSPSNGASAEIYQQDGDYIKDIEVNDLRNRYTLTKGSTQKMIKDKTGADVTTRGAYYPDKAMATAANPPLYLHITSQTKEGLEKAVDEINELMNQDLPNLIDERRFRRREPEQFERDERGRRKWPEEKIPVMIEPVPGFNLRAQVVGQGGSYVKHIQQETKCRVQIKGRGSGYLEHDTGREADEQMYLHVAGPDPNEVQRAKTLCLELLEEVGNQYKAFKERGPPQRGPPREDRRSMDQNGYGSRGSYGGGSSHGGYGGYGGGAQSPGGYGQASSAMSPSVAGQTSQDYAQYAQQWQQWQQANPDQDPYAAYGGYEAYMKMCQDYYYGQQGAQGSPQQGGYAGYQAPGQDGSGGAPPPPPPAEQQAPPPPPPGASGQAGYNSVPPPPGM